MKRQEFIDNIVDPTLKTLGLYSNKASILVTMCIAHESLRLKYNRQIKGPARGVAQIEPTTHDAIIRWLKQKRPDLVDILLKEITPKLNPELMTNNIKYSVAMCRLFFYRFPEPIPETEEEMAKYLKYRYNTYLGKATPEEYLRDYLTWQ